MLAMQHTAVLPPGNQLPSTYEAALRAIEPYLVQPIVYDVRPNDCIIFRGEYASVLECPKCVCGRFVSDQSRITSSKVHVPIYETSSF